MPAFIYVILHIRVLVIHLQSDVHSWFSNSVLSSIPSSSAAVASSSTTSGLFAFHFLVEIFNKSPPSSLICDLALTPTELCIDQSLDLSMPLSHLVKPSQWPCCRTEDRGEDLMKIYRSHPNS